MTDCVYLELHDGMSWFGAMVNIQRVNYVKPGDWNVEGVASILSFGGYSWGCSLTVEEVMSAFGWEERET